MNFRNVSRFILGSVICFLLLFCVCAGFAAAQAPPEIKAIQAKMQSGVPLTAEEQKQFNDYLKALDEKLKQSMEKLKNIGAKKPVDITKPVSLPEDSYLPKFKAGTHYADVPAPILSEYQALVKKYNDASGTDLADIKTKLDQSLIQVKTANALSNLAMTTLMGESSDHDLSATALYEITAAALRDPKDGNIAGNFGVLLKNAGEYEDSLKVLLYAEKQSPPSALVQTNLGWTIAYLGDFFTAKARFQKAIDLDKYDSKAYEGMGILYRVEGNIQEASKYLRMCLKNGYSAVAANNLTLVEGKVDAVIATDPDSIEADSTPGMRLSDVLEFPYPDGQGSQGSANGKLLLSDAPDYFSVSIKRVAAGHAKDEFLRFDLDKKAAFETAGDALEEARTSLGPIRPAPIRSGDSITYPRSYELEAFALVDTEHVFAKRHLLRVAKFARRFQTEIHLPVTDKYRALQIQFETDYRACNRDEPCQEAAARKVCRARIDNIKGFNGSFQALWAKYVQEERADLNRYYDYATPWLREIKDPKLNNYMNMRREFFIRAADPLEELGIWGPWEVDAFNNWSDDCGQDPPPASAGTNLRNKLKVFPEPYGTCHVPQYKVSGGIGIMSASTEATCDSLKFEFGAFGLYGGVDRKFGEKESDDITSFHFGLGEKAGFSNSAGGVNLVGKLGYYTSFRDGEMVDNGVEGSAGVVGTIGNVNTGLVKGQILNLESIKISGESGPRSNGDSPVNFNSAFGN